MTLVEVAPVRAKGFDHATQGLSLGGRSRLFLWEDSVERAWEILKPALDLRSEPLPYKAGTWGRRPLTN